MHTFWLLLCMMNFFVIFGFYNTYNIPQINIVSRCMCKCLIRKTFTYIHMYKYVHTFNTIDFVTFQLYYIIFWITINK